MGKALRDGYRQKAFLMTKIDGRTSRGSRPGRSTSACCDCGADIIDLMQVHEVIRIRGSGSRFRPMAERWRRWSTAKKAGKIRFIGFTGPQGSTVHLQMLEIAAATSFRFDTVQLPLNVMDAHYRSFEHQVLPRLVKDEVGVLGMKALGDPFIVESKTVTPIEALHYAMNLPTSTVITGIDSMKILDQAVEAARTFKPLTKGAVASLLARTATAAATGKFEQFKTSNRYDGTFRNPHWLG